MYLLFCNECGRKANRLKRGPHVSSFAQPLPGWWWVDDSRCHLCNDVVQSTSPSLVLMGHRPATFDEYRQFLEGE